MLLDTHVLAWAMVEPHRLSRRVQSLLLGGVPIRVSAVSFYEIAWKVSRGQWPEMEGNIERFERQVLAGRYEIVDLDLATARLAGEIRWDNGDPFDRLIAATAIRLVCPVITKDNAFRRLDDPVWLW